MEWYLWLIIVYGVLIFINTLVGIIESYDRFRWEIIFAFIAVFILGLVFTPILWLFTWYVFAMHDNPNYKTFTIHKLTEENKNTLRQLGFQEGKFVSNNNIDYEGFRYSDSLIGISYNGRVFVKYLYRLSKEQKHLMEQIKALPKPINYDEKIEELQKQIKDKKERQTDWKIFYQEDIEKLNKQIEELKLKKQEENK
jgi:uncharacterized membrane protein YgaE (UPF0421/DUF939 family)